MSCQLGAIGREVGKWTAIVVGVLDVLSRAQAEIDQQPIDGWAK